MYREKLQDLHKVFHCPSNTSLVIQNESHEHSEGCFDMHSLYKIYLLPSK